jgi:hypothetical protein
MAVGRTFRDVHLSLLEYLAHLLPSSWDVQPVRREPQTRPLCVCQPVGAVPSSGTAYVREFVQAFEVLAYPPGVDGDVAAAAHLAMNTKQLLLRAFDSGAGTGRNRGYSMRVPLFDFAEVADDEELPPDQQPHDYLVVQALDGDARQDPEQDDLWTVMLDFRVNWRDDGDRSRFEGVTLESIGLRQLPPTQGGP